MKIYVVCGYYTYKSCEEAGSIEKVFEYTDTEKIETKIFKNEVDAKRYKDDKEKEIMKMQGYGTWDKRDIDVNIDINEFEI